MIKVDYAASDALAAVDIFTNFILAKMLERAPQRADVDRGAISEEEFWVCASSFSYGWIDVSYKNKSKTQKVTNSDDQLTEPPVSNIRCSMYKYLINSAISPAYISNSNMYKLNGKRLNYLIRRAKTLPSLK